MRLVIFDLSWLFWSVAMGPASAEPNAPYELTIGRIKQLSDGFDRVAIACDGGRSFRTEIDPDYKRNRRERPPHLWQQLDAVREDAARFGCVFVPPAYPDGTYPEGDDVVATIVSWYRGHRSPVGGDVCRIVTGDSDLAALVNDAWGIEIAREVKGAWRTVREVDVPSWLTVPASLIAEHKALAGDDTDGYKPFPGPEKGKPGIGGAGARSLLLRYGSAIASVRAAMEEPPPADVPANVIATLRRCGELAAIRGLELASLRADVALDLSGLLEPFVAPKGEAPPVEPFDISHPVRPPGMCPLCAAPMGPEACQQRGAELRCVNMHRLAEREETPPEPAPQPPPPVAPAPPPAPKVVERRVHIAPPPAEQRSQPPMTEAAESKSSLRTSAQIDLIAEALAAAQGEIEAAVKDSVNGHFERTYADLASVWRACRSPLSKNGLCVVQVPTNAMLITRVIHRSGQWIEGEIKWVIEPGGRSAVQALGSALTYLRRYALSAMVGVAPDDDDDGERAEQRGPVPPPRTGNGNARRAS